VQYANCMAKQGKKVIHRGPQVFRRSQETILDPEAKKAVLRARARVRYADLMVKQGKKVKPRGPKVAHGTVGSSGSDERLRAVNGL
jgi:hypothetical protein